MGKQSKGCCIITQRFKEINAELPKSSPSKSFLIELSTEVLLVSDPTHYSYLLYGAHGCSLLMIHPRRCGVKHSTSADH